MVIPHLLQYKESTANTSLEFELSPNPANETIQINFATTQNTEHYLSIYSANGKAVFTKTLSVSSLANQHQVDVSNLPAGMYLVQLRNAKGSFCKKLFLE